MELAVRGEPLDRLDSAAVGLHGEEEARTHRTAVNADRARAADAVLAADVRSGQAERVPEKIGEQKSWLAVPPARAPVDGKLDGGHGDAAVARIQADRTARSTSVPNSARR